MANLAKIKKIQARFADKATFLTIYTQGKVSLFETLYKVPVCYLKLLCIAEAHPTEGGDYIDYFLPIKEHQTLDQRMKAAGTIF